MFHELFLQKRRPRLYVVLVYLIAALGALYVALIDPDGSELYPHCTLYRWTGLHCPGCGCLRATHQLLRGHVLTAFDLNPVYVLMLPAFLYPVLSDVAFVLRGRPWPPVHIPSRGVWGLFVVLIAFAILRNIPVYPFTFLAP